MKNFPLLALALLALFPLPGQAAEEIGDFLGLKFGSSREIAKQTMTSRGFKLASDAASDAVTFREGTYSGQPVKELKLEFAGDKFLRATVAFEIHSGKREECARLGLDAYDQVRKALTEKYGEPASASNVPRAKILSDKIPQNTSLKAVWRTSSGLSGVHRSIVLSTATIALYSWVFNTVYEDAGVHAGTTPAPARKDL